MAEGELGAPGEPAPDDPLALLWQAVMAEPLAAFDSWMKLAQAGEKKGEIEYIRAIYDQFLSHFPLCYGYWKKYADAESRVGDPAKVHPVYERGAAAVPYSVDMWLNYVSYFLGATEDEEAIRSFHQELAQVHRLGAPLQIVLNCILFERGLQYVGADWAGHQLWEKYIDWERGRSGPAALANLYGRVLQIPIRELDRFWDNFKQFAAETPLDLLFTADEAAAAAALTQPSEAYPNMTDPAGPEAQLAWYISLREPHFAAAKAEQQRRLPFESKIKRLYFHVKPLDDAQLTAWSRYLDDEEARAAAAGGNAVALYERCMVACANYPDFWLRYVSYLETCAGGSLDSARAVLLRATATFVSRRPEVLLALARIEERSGDAEAARAVFDRVLGEVAPGHVSAISAKANFERRSGSAAAACAAFESALSAPAPPAGEPSDDHIELLFLHYARFASHGLGDDAAARAVYERAVVTLPLRASIWEAFLAFEAAAHPPSAEKLGRVAAVIDRASAEPAEGTEGLSAVVREQFAIRGADLADLLGDADAVRKATELVRTRFKDSVVVGGPVVSLKRPAASAAAAQPAAKAAKTEAAGVPDPSSVVAQQAAGAPAAYDAAAYSAYAAQYATQYGGHVYPGYPPAAPPF